jgi:hypothetical protein
MHLYILLYVFNYFQGKKFGRLAHETFKKMNDDIEDANGKNERCLLFTEKEIQRAESRSKRNIEDIPNKNFLTDLLD